MQTNTVNSINFGQKLEMRPKDAAQRKEQNRLRAEEYRRAVEEHHIGEGNDEQLSLEEKLNIIDGAVSRANSNVHPSTIICSVVGMVAAGLAATKFTKAGRRFAITVAESASKTAVELASKVKKAGKEIDVNAIKDKITTKADTLRNGNPDSKLLDKISDFTGKVFGDEKAALIKEKLLKAGVKDGVSLFDAATGVVAAATVLDPASDAIEQRTDKREVLEVVNSLL